MQRSNYLPQIGCACISGALCAFLMQGPLLAEPSRKHKPVPPRQGAAALQGDQRILQALNRLTFGPRPGELEAVKAMGLDMWIDQQLDPSSIDDHALDTRLAAFPAMQLSIADLVRKFPPNQVIKQAADGNAAIPSDPEEHAIYVNEIARYRSNQARQAALAQQTPGAQSTGPNGSKEISPATGSRAAHGSGNIPISGGATNDMQGARQTATANGALPGDGVDPSTPDMKTHEQQMYADLEATEIINLLPDKRMVRLISMQPGDLQQFTKDLTPEERRDLSRDLTPQQREVLVALVNPRQVVAGELMQSKLIRAIYSDRQLQEVMTDFWLNHFNVYIRKGPLAPYDLVTYERDVIRPRALGKFEDLLVATAQSPAMLFYLDNFTSIGPDSLAAERARKRAEFSNNPAAKAGADRGLNENYGRELMELHTLGVNGGYTQQDVTQAAKVFTGWTIEKPFQGGGFTFEENRHEPGPKVVLGQQIAAAGEREGLEVLHMLATSPATARFVSSELAVRFVSDTPPPALVDRMAQSWLASGGDIRTVLKTMINSPEFWSKDVFRVKFKTPLEYVVSAARASGTDVQNAQPLVNALDKLGMPLYGCQPPTGYSEMADAWLNTAGLVNRMNFSVAFAANRFPGERTDWNAELGAEPVQLASLQTGGGPSSGQTQARVSSPLPLPVVENTVEQREARLEMLLLGAAVGGQTRQTVLSQGQATPEKAAAEKSFAITLSEGPQLAPSGAAQGQLRPMMPEEKQSALMAGLLLGSPEFQRR